MLRSSSTRSFQLAAALVAALLGLLLLAAPPAAAHDVLVESVPADGDTLDDAPAEVTLTFNNEPLDLGSALSLRDDAGQEVLEVEGSATGYDIVFDLGDATADGGDFEASWRVVSSDGHPIEGTLDFSVAADEAAVQPTAAPETTAEAIAPTAEPDVAGTAPDDGAESAEATGLAALPLWLKVAIAVAALGSVVTLITIAVRRTRNERS